MFKHVLIGLILILPCANCFLKETKEYFIYEGVDINEEANCAPLNVQQYYMQTFNNGNNSSDTVKLNCLPASISKDKYFPKCCPPNYVYHRKHHKCIYSNVTNIHDDFGSENLLIRTDLFNCAVVLDHILLKNQTIFRINSDRSLIFKGRTYKLGNYCLENNFDVEEEFIIRTCEDINVCKNDEIKCIKKCCPDGQYYKGIKCHPGAHFGLSLENNTRFLDQNENFDAVMVSKPCRKYMEYPSINFHITEDGTTVIQEMGVWKHFSLEENYYCVEYVQVINQHKILLCMIDGKVTVKDGVKGTFLIISCICLLLTVIGYFMVPDLKNLIGNIIITYCSCLFVAFVILTWLQFFPNPGGFCHSFAFVNGFAFLTAFAWMTILSFEIWRVLGSMVTEYGHRSSTEMKRYLRYSIFGWLTPIIIIIINLIDHIYNIFPTPIHLILGVDRCVFENNRSKGMYGYIFQFVLPCGIFLIINLIIFIKTMNYIFQVKNEIKKMKSLDRHVKQKRWKTFIADKEKVTMLIRIFLLMGLNWLFETFSSIFDFSNNETLRIIEVVFDDFNALQGVFIFCIFMLKKKILKSVSKVLNIKGKSRRSSVATCSTEVVMIPTSIRTSHSN